MKVEDALKIIIALSDGVDPGTGEVLDENNCINSPNTIRALCIAKESLDKALRIENRKNSLPNNAGKPWRSEEDDELVARFDSGLNINELVKLHQRTKGSIGARLVRLGKITDRSDITTSCA